MRRLRLLLVAGLLSSSCAGLPNEPTPLSSPSSLRARVVEIPNPHATENSDSIIRQVELDEIHAAVARTVTLSGAIVDKAYPAWKVSGATVTLTPTALTTRTTSVGRYTLRPRTGTYSLKIVKTGYTTATIRGTIGSALTLNVELVPKKPSGATARCKDRTWSLSQVRSGTCSHHKGVAYWVCPGKLCR